MPTRDCISIAIIATTIHATIALWLSPTTSNLTGMQCLIEHHLPRHVRGTTVSTRSPPSALAFFEPSRFIGINSAAPRAAAPFLTTNTLEPLPVMGHAADSRYHLGQRAAVVGPSMGSCRFNTIYAIRSLVTYRVHSMPTPRNRGALAELHPSSAGALRNLALPHQSLAIQLVL